MNIEIRHDMTVELIQQMGNDNSVTHAAWVSTKASESKQIDESKTEGLIRFLMKNRHGTPFEHNSFTFFIQAPILVFREFMRHRIGFSYNEESGRYRELDPVFYIPAEKRNLIQVGKAGHYTFEPGTKHQYEYMVKSMQEAYNHSYNEYIFMLQIGIAKEIARSVLPVGIYSSMYVTCNARSIMSLLSLRTKREDSKFPSYPQREIEMVAESIEEVFKSHMPLTYKAFNDYGRVSP